MKKQNKKKWKFNEEKFLRNLAITVGGYEFISLIIKIATNGISWISTIGYFG